MFFIILFVIILIPCFILFVTLFAINYFYNIDNFYKFSIYECGFDVRCNCEFSNFNFNFIFITLIFLVIDFELMLAFFWLISFSHLTFVGFFVMAFFGLILDFSYFYLFFLINFI